jgi:hypothetical protein
LRLRALVAAGVAVALLAAGTATVVGARSAAGRVEADLVAARDLLATAADPAIGAVAARLALVEQAGAHVRRARATLAGFPLAQLGALPVVGRDVRVARAVASAAAATVDATEEVVRQLGPLEDAGPDARRLRAASAAMAALAATLRAAAGQVRGTRPLLLAGEARRDFLAGADSGARTADAASQGLRLASGLYGRAGAARWLLGFQNPAELRGTGGLIGQYGVLESSPAGPRLVHVGAYLELDRRLAGAKGSTPLSGPVARRYGRFGVNRTWSAVNIPPDLPTVGRLMAGMYKRTTGHRLDGVVLIDPLAVADVLAVSGPITVQGVHLDAGNVVTETLVRAYVRWSDDNLARKRFLDEVARATFAAARRTLERRPLQLVRGLGKAAAGRHLLLWPADGRARKALAGLGLSGSAAAPPSGDYLMPVGVNAAGNKLDTFLQRRLRWDVRLAPDGAAAASARLSLRNAVPGLDLPRYVVGPYDHRFEAGEQRQFQSLYVAGGYGFTSATENGRPVGAESQADVGATVLSRYVSIPAGRTTTLGFELRRRLAAEVADGRLRYRLLVRPQPVVNPDRLEVVVRAPEGWQFTAVPRGFTVQGRVASWSGPLLDERSLEFVAIPPS